MNCMSMNSAFVSLSLEASEKLFTLICRRFIRFLLSYTVCISILKGGPGPFSQSGLYAGSNCVRATPVLHQLYAIPPAAGQLKYIVFLYYLCFSVFIHFMRRTSYVYGFSNVQALHYYIYYKHFICRSFPETYPFLLVASVLCIFVSFQYS